MNDVMVSIRMPDSLLAELKELSRSKHFMDISEQIRSIARKKWMEHTNPELFELKQLRSDIEDEIKSKSVERVRAEVNKELELIKNQLRKGDLLK